MVQEGQESKRHSAYAEHVHHCDHQNPYFKPLQQQCPKNQGHLYANLSVRLQGSQLLSDEFQLCDVGLICFGQEGKKL